LETQGWAIVDLRGHSKIHDTFTALFYTPPPRPPPPLWHLVSFLLPPSPLGLVWCDSRSKQANKVRMLDSYTNPSESIWIKSFEIFGLTNRIHDTNLLKTASRIESANRIFWKQHHKTNPRIKSFELHTDSRIRKFRIRLSKVHLCTKDSWGLVGFVRICRIFWKLPQESNPQIESLENCVTNRIRKLNLWKTASWIESANRIFWKLPNQNNMNPWICKTNPCFYESLMRFPHP
jgi:hypothetical protein